MASKDESHEPIEEQPSGAGNETVPLEHTRGNNSTVVGKGFQIQGSIADFDPGSLKTGSVSSNYSLPLSWHKLHYSAGSYHILKGLTGTALPGRCVAILGSSGAGKTTFLNAVCDRLATGGKLKLSGRRQLGDVEFVRHYRKAMGFVTQDDIVSSMSTPYDSLWFSLRTRRGTDRAETKERVMETLETLRLLHCKDTKVGVPGLEAGLSGGERKRTNIGIELICDPKVLMLDEPTSGLDSVTSAKIVHLLRQLSRLGRTIIYTIHQPTAEVVSYFDDLMLLTMGRCVYHGTMASSLDYFASIGFPCPDKYTPTDHFMVLLQDTVTSKVMIKRWRKFLKNGRRTPHTAAVRLAPDPNESSAAKFLNAYIQKFGSSPPVQFEELIKRFVIEILRNRLYQFSLFSQAIFFSIVVGLIFLHMRMNVGGMTDRIGLLFMAVMNRSMGPAFLMLNTFHNVRPVYGREQQAGAYSPVMFYVTRILSQLPFQVSFCLLECVILYFMTGLHANPGAFFYYFGVIALVSETGTVFGFLMSAVFESLVVAGIITPLILVPISLAGGLFASTDRLRPYWYWIEKPSFMRHGYILVMRNEFKYIGDIACNNYAKGDDYCVNQYQNGNDVMTQLGFNSDPQSATVYMWISLMLMYFLLAICGIIALQIAARKKI